MSSLTFLVNQKVLVIAQIQYPCFTNDQKRIQFFKATPRQFYKLQIQSYNKKY